MPIVGDAKFMSAPKKSLGQHWLSDEQILGQIADAADVVNGDHILEIGPGKATLTRILLERGAKVTAVEIDSSLASELSSHNLTNLEVINSDILSFDYRQMKPGYKIVANIPYYLTSNLVRVISETANPPSTAVILIQKEVAERAAAKPGDMSLLSVTAQFYWQVSLGIIVPPEAFEPPPKVDSQVLILQKRSKPLYDDVAPKEFFRLVKAGFSQKRKTLLNSLSAGLQLDKQTTAQICDSVGIDPSRRPQTLSLDEWHNLYLSYIT